MRVRRDISSIPFRPATETWEKIVSLITGSESKHVQQLRAASGTMGSIIGDEHPGRRAIVIEGVGPQLRIYCRYGATAIETGDDADPLQWNPTAGDWIMHVPCDAENISWVKASLAKTSSRIKVFDVDEEERADEATAQNVSEKIVVDWNLKG